MNWKLQSKCGNDPNILEIMKTHHWDPFFDEKAPEDKEWIKQYCANCPVLIECRGAGKFELGAWGGKPSRARHYQNSVNEAKILEFLAQTKIQLPDKPSVPTEVRGDDCA